MLHLHPGAFETGRLPRASSPAARRVVISVCTRPFSLVVDQVMVIVVLSLDRAHHTRLSPRPSCLLARR